MVWQINFYKVLSYPIIKHYSYDEYFLYYQSELAYY